jgi:ABC-type dipeptide/oligopeptide/nickel transport system permease subunit
MSPRVGILFGFIGRRLDEIGARMVDVMPGFPAIIRSCAAPCRTTTSNSYALMMSGSGKV